MHALPTVVESLLNATDPSSRDESWARFLREYSALILHVLRRGEDDHDHVMEQYTFVLDAIKRDDFARLRAFRANGRGKFSTWLVTVLQRLRVDAHRARYGRPQGAGEAGWRTQRRNLVELVGDELAFENLPSDEASAETLLLRQERRAILAAALAALEPSERLILRLRFEDGVAVPEIARLLSRPSPFALYREIDRLLARLRAALEARGISHAAS